MVTGEDERQHGDVHTSKLQQMSAFLLRRLHGSVLPHGSDMDLQLTLGGWSPAPSPSHHCSLGYAGGETQRCCSSHQDLPTSHLADDFCHLLIQVSRHAPRFHGASLKGRQLPDSQWAIMSSNGEEPWLTLPSAGLTLQRLQELQLKFHMNSRSLG